MPADLDTWKHYSPQELRLQYNARATVPDVEPLLRDYRSASTPMYAQLACERNVPYGEGPDERMDLFPVPGRPDAPWFFFIHGGYWRALAKEDSVFMAHAFVDQGIAVAALDYTLAPAATLETIVAQCRRALVFLHQRGARRIVVAGSSAGAHLAAMLLASDWLDNARALAGCVRGAVLASGLFDLRPLLHADAQAWLGLDDARARALSPAFHLPSAGRLCVLAAEHDSDEFKRQSASYAQACAAGGCEVTHFVVEGRNHFDVIMDWTRPDSRLMQSTLALF